MAEKTNCYDLQALISLLLLFLEESYKTVVVKVMNVSSKFHGEKVS